MKERLTGEPSDSSRTVGKEGGGWKSDITDVPLAGLLPYFGL